MGLKKFFNSFTSYQFPNPFNKAQDPLSRLEFPLDQWFVGVCGGLRGELWELHGQVWINANRESGLKMQDSDWDDESMPSQKTVFSESSCRLNRGILADITLGVNVGDAIFPLTPVAGYRFQRFHFITHDGYQTTLGAPGMDLPGDGIDFRQTYHHFFWGGRTQFVTDASARSDRWSWTGLELQLDYARVTGHNEDHHLLRDGNRITKDTTSGHCWHIFAAAGFRIRTDLSARIEVDFKRIVTTGSHRLLNETFGIDFSFDGARVWSDQTSIFASLTMAL